MRALLAAGVVLIAMTGLVLSGITHDFDRDALRALQRLANGPLDLAANVHTVAGLPYVTLPLAAAWSHALWRRGRGAASLAPLLIVVAVAIELALKLTTGHAPPGPETSRTFIHFVPAPDTPSSFPSGHATRLTFLSALAALVAGRRGVTVAAVAFVAFTLVARVYIGDHWPTDVIGGAALGLAFALLAAAWLRGSLRHGGRRLPPSGPDVVTTADQSAASKSSFARRK